MVPQWATEYLAKLNSLLPVRGERNIVRRGHFEALESLRGSPFNARKADKPTERGAVSSSVFSADQVSKDECSRDRFTCAQCRWSGPRPLRFVN